MMPVDLGQLSQTSPKDSPKTVDADARGFEELLNQVQSLQWTALAGTSARGSSLVPAPEGTGGDARESRINQETQSARQAEVASSRTRGADPSSVQNGVVSQRHERVLAQKAAVGEGQPPAESKPAIAPESGNAFGKADVRNSSSSNFSSVMDPSKPLDQAKTTSTPANNPLVAENKPANDAPQPNPIRVAPKAESSPTVNATAFVTNDKPVNQATTADRVGQLLNGKVQGSALRTTPSVHAGRGDAQKNTQQGVGGKARTASTAQGRASAEETGATKRSVFEGLVKSIRMNRGVKSTSATIRLNPPELGQMRIRAQMSDDVLKVRVEASSDAARSLLSERSDELVSALRERGIDVDRFEVLHVDSLDNEETDADGQAGNNLEQSETMHDRHQHTTEHTAEGEDAAVSTSELDTDEQLEATVELDARLDVRI